jgi:hypothetical protein
VREPLRNLVAQHGPPAAEDIRCAKIALAPRGFAHPVIC